MQICFLLGPAGSGKTHRCLSEIREELHRDPAGAPLILLAPKQATFQLERQLLTGGDLPGYTRLRILSFERLAEFIFDQLGVPVPKLLAEEGRVMVLRALLEQKRSELKLFRSSARLPGFARQLSQVLRELQQYHLNPPRLETLADEITENHRLNAKLRDLALILRAYADWLKTNQLQDADSLLDLAAQELRFSNATAPAFRIAGLWLDGFAQMTPQERQLLVAIVRCSDCATLAFCLEGSPNQKPPWHSSWAPVTETFQRCRDELSALPDAIVKIENLPRDSARTRFQLSPALQHLERHWGKPGEFTNYDLGFTHAASETNSIEDSSVRVVSCVNPETEVEFAAREIHRFVREGRGRFRDIAVLLRSLDGYHDSIRRVFERYEIPFFLDRRESVTHHPLAELTRYALRVIAHGWEHDDWFGALKTGLVHADENAIDRLENEALEHGWRGQTFWTEPIQLPGWTESAVRPLEKLREKLAAPFLQFADSLTVSGGRLNGSQISAAIRELWSNLKVNQQLERWSVLAGKKSAHLNPAVHETVWDQMIAWLQNLELAFAHEALFLNEWLPIVEAGLSNLSVGVIPPALDQVLVGAIDRSRNPDLQMAFVLGVNEGVFPAPPATPILLNRSDREMLALHNAPVGPDFLNQIGLERYYGYIACTRARREIVLTFAHRDSAGRELNPSAFIDDLQRLFPSLSVEHFESSVPWQNAEHWSELIVPLLKHRELSERPELNRIAPLKDTLEKADELARLADDETLSPELVEKLYGVDLKTSVSGLEDFAACPFRFFVSRGLRAEERIEFEIDPREKGSFQHDVLKEFHQRLKADGKRWRDITPAEARLRIRQIGEELLPEFREGLFVAAQARRFVGRMLIEGLERLVETLIAWTAHYQFDPAAVELGFGLPDSSLPAWRIDLDEHHALLLRGRIDRVDLCRIEETGETLAVVIDYKSSARKLNNIRLSHGLDLQLLAYLGALRQFKNLDGDFNARELIPAGAFYVALKNSGSSAASREHEREAREIIRRKGGQHRGRFDGGYLSRFDTNGSSDQFCVSIKKDGTFAARGNEALSAEQFQNLIVQIEDFLRRHGRDIYAGKIAIEPFRLQGKTACDFCDYRPVCRFDPWTQTFRVLRDPAN
ncbi:MAG TPA: PD-(D/E)XK nuclease family protein [Verrucomicrobiae bacterium]|nr:PD-(D/E)XK nuclease family protein [Verrucomicrobiae bacterium]